MEISALHLASQLHKEGHEVKVVTDTCNQEVDVLPFKVARRPTMLDLFNLGKWAEVHIHNHISLRYAIPLALFGPPQVFRIAGWIEPDNKFSTFAGKLKRWLLSRHHCIANGVEVYDELRARSKILVPPPYDPDIYFLANRGCRVRDFTFVGRLTNEKGVDLLLQAMAIVRGEVADVNLTILGDGPERRSLEILAEQLGLSECVQFVGSAPPDQVSKLLNETKVMVAPSFIIEPFGIVALEGLASGCEVVVPDRGGFSHALGRFGTKFEHRDLRSLCGAMLKALERSGQNIALYSEVKEHLANYEPFSTTRQILDFSLSNTR
ncbi:glycosyltransferase family 4 protein [Microvirga aerophila]|uniref:Glycosyl transferase family 1 domain-containing protein n=1 Tax=Microvirga aerophila TaxID=670291 RepID=A0A512BUY3_9HYPH|nr:glycosyltransferase family 4 protein [Microvirga aerophila]GEO15762.1 hypothetical protein MAE02_34580 [Microvirga aerophila]